jgi:type I restriction enzyme S subunit
MKWKSCLVGDFVDDGLAEIQTGPFGTQLKASDYVSDGTPVINVRNIGFGDLRPDKIEYVGEETAERLSAHFLAPGDIVFGRKGAVDRHLFVQAEHDKWMQGSDCIRLRFLTDQIRTRFISYAFLRKDHQQWMLTQAGNKATMASLNQDIIRRIPVTAPPPDTQERVVDVLSAYDDLIENNRRRMALLEESARLLYREWFVRLRFPGHQHTPVVNGLPKGWAHTTVGDHIQRGYINLQTGPFGTQLRASDYVAAGTPVINVRNIGYGDVREDKLEFVSDEVVERLGVHVLQVGDIVFGRKGAVDRHVLISSDQTGWMQGSDCIRLRTLGDSVCPLFLSFTFREEGHKQWMLNQCGNKATMASLNQDVISRIPIIDPRSSLVRDYREFTASILAQIALLQRQSALAVKARDLLLSRLMSGEIAV